MGLQSLISKAFGGPLMKGTIQVPSVIIDNCFQLREFHKITYGRPVTDLFIYVILKVSAIVRFQLSDKAFTFVVT